MLREVSQLTSEDIVLDRAVLRENTETKKEKQRKI